MKRILYLLLCFLFVFTASVYAVDESRAYEFVLLVNGNRQIDAEPGDIITVTAYLHRKDSSELTPVYAIQDEIHYDGSLLELVDDRAIMAPGIVTTDISISETERAFYITFASFGGGEEWEADKLLGCFQMRVLGDTGIAELTQENYLVSKADGTDSYESFVQDASVKLPFEEYARETIVLIIIALVVTAVILSVFVFVKLKRAYKRHRRR